MKHGTFIIAALAACLSGCSRSDQQQADHAVKQAGQKVKQELHRDAAFMKQEAEKARVETQKGVSEIRKKAAVKTRSLREREREKPAE